MFIHSVITSLYCIVVLIVSDGAAILSLDSNCLPTYEGFTRNDACMETWDSEAVIGKNIHYSDC